MDRDRLIAAYRRTNYFVGEGDDAILIRVDETCSPLDRLLEEAGVSEWAFVTAWNGMDERPDLNDVRQRRLIADIAAAGWSVRHGVGRSPENDWAEDSVLILGSHRAEAEALGRRYQQRAIVVGRRGDPARLVMLDEESPLPS